jgi:hypothetical protein
MLIHVKGAADLLIAGSGLVVGEPLTDIAEIVELARVDRPGEQRDGTGYDDHAQGNEQVKAGHQ